jgi:precorrin-4 methylase
MAAKTIKVEQLKLILRLHESGYSKKGIARTTGLAPNTVIYRVSWPDQRIIRATLATIQARVKGQGITRTALILVGRSLDASSFADSRLYASEHHHVLRPAKVEAGNG